MVDLVIQPGSPAPNAPAQPPASVPSPVDQHPQGARVPTGLPYGQHQMLQNAQRQMPVAGGTSSTPGPVTPGNPGPLPPDHPQVLQAAQNFTPPIMPLSRPSSRPLEPIQSGIPNGPGPGPEALAGNAFPQAGGQLSSLLAQMAQHTGSSAIALLAQRAQQSGA